MEAKRRRLFPLVFTVVAIIVIMVWCLPYARLQWNIRKLHHHDDAVKEEATAALAKIGKPAVPALIKVLEDDNDGIWDPELLRAAVNALAKIGPDAEEAIPALIRSDAPEVPTARIVAGFGMDAIPYCIEALKTDRAEAQECPSKVLMLIGDEAIPSIIEALETEDWRLRRAAARIFQQLAAEGKLVKEAIGPLVALRWDINTDVRIWGVRALQEYGGDDGRVVEALMMLTNDGDLDVRRLAVNALGKMGPQPGVVDALLRRVSDSDHYIRIAAITPLGEMGPDPKAVSALIGVLESGTDSGEKTAAAGSLGVIGPEPGVVEVLTRALDDVWSNVRAAAATALGRIGKDAEPALQKLKELTKRDPADRDDIFIEKIAEDAIARIEQEMSEG